MKTLEIKTLRSGDKAALVVLNNGGFLVYKQSTNYVQGKNIVKWRPYALNNKQCPVEMQKMFKVGMTEKDARVLYSKKK